MRCKICSNRWWTLRAIRRHVCNARRATRGAYSAFLHRADLINKYGQPELTGHKAAVEQAAAARRHFEQVLQQVAAIVPQDLL